MVPLTTNISWCWRFITYLKVLKWFANWKSGIAICLQGWQRVRNDCGRIKLQIKTTVEGTGRWCFQERQFCRPSWTLTPPDDVSAFFSLYDSMIHTLVDKHVPTNDVVNRSRQCSPWFNHRCQATKRATRCLERRYRHIHTAAVYRPWCAQHVHHRQVFQAEYAAYWSSAIDMCPDSRSLWNRMNSLLRPVESTFVTHTADDFSTFFTGKVDTIRATTAIAPAPTIEHRQVPSLARLNNVTVEEVSQIMRNTPNKQCDLSCTLFFSFSFS